METENKITLRLSAEYGSFPLWIVGEDGLENIRPEDLDIPQNLALEIERWSDLFESTYRENAPSESGFDTEHEYTAFLKIGEQLAKNLKLHIGHDYIIEYRHKHY